MSPRVPSPGNSPTVTLWVSGAGLALELGCKPSVRATLAVGYLQEHPQEVLGIRSFSPYLSISYVGASIPTPMPAGMAQGVHRRAVCTHPAGSAAPSSPISWLRSGPAAPTGWHLSGSPG